MPRVDQRYLDARRGQILNAARRCFVRDGFHQTSMQDIFAEAGLSAGAVYRYFPGKDDIVRAIAQRMMHRLAQAIDPPCLAPPLPPLAEWLGGILDRIDEAQRDDGTASIALQVWAESLRSPQLATLLGEIMLGIRERLAATVGRYLEAGRLPGDAGVDDLTSTITGLLQGYVVQVAAIPGADGAAYRRGLRVLIDAHALGH